MTRLLAVSAIGLTMFQANPEPDVIDRFLATHHYYQEPDALDRHLLANVMIEATSQALPRSKKTPVWQRGGVMEGTFSYYGRVPTENQKAYLGKDWNGIYVAVVDCSKVGDMISVDIGRGWETAMIFDCQGEDAHIPDENGRTVYDDWVSEDWLFELDYYTATQIGTYGNGLTPGRMKFH